MKALNYIDMFMQVIKIIGLIIFILFALNIINLILSNFLIARNTVLWFLGESGMIGFMTIQIIWAFCSAILFFFVYRLFFNRI